jgi:hypothetical protein
VFWDLRVELDSRLLHAVAQARRDSRAWEALLRAYGVDAALLRYDERPRPMAAPGGGAVEHHTSSALYFPPESFALVYWDDAAMLFLRRTASRAVQLAREEYRFVQPEDWRATLDRAAGDPAARAGALAEVERRLNEDPSSVRARRLQAELRALPPASP